MKLIVDTCALLGLAVFCVAASAAEEATLPTAAQLLDKAMGNRELQTTTGEQFTWHAAYNSHSFLTAYEASGATDPSYLEAAQKYYDWSIEKVVSNDPDGFPGTIGAGIGEDIAQSAIDAIADTLVGDANIAWPLVEFAEHIKAKPELRERFGKRADDYVALATRMIWDKWNARGCYYQDSHGFGSYHTHDKAIDKADRSKWVERPNVVSDNLNKHYKAGMVLLGLYHLTGKTEYRDRVVAIFSRAKAMFRLLPDEDRIVWNFWMPHGPYDIDGTTPKSWVGVHPSRPGYQVFEASAFVSVYDSGLVFERSDIERIVRTNAWMIANGLQNADGTAKAGAIWGALARFDEGIRTTYEKSIAKDALALAHLHNVTMKHLGYDRLKVADQKAVKIPVIAVQPGRRISLAYPIPDMIETANQDRVRLVTRIMEKARVTIELLAADGATVLGTVATCDIADSFAAPRWDGTNPKTGTKDPGEYLLRWTCNGEVRVSPITIKVGVAHAKPDTPPALAVGGSLMYDFDKPLDARWKLEGGAAIGSDQHQSGTQALRIGRKESATVVFGDQNAVPARITFSAFDGGAKHGAKNGNGFAMGIRTEDGDIFAVRQVWRGYLKGDADYAWVNTGENQWFSPHPAGIGRSEGWNRWTLDFSKPNDVVVERDGKRIEAKKLDPVRWIPTGGVALVFIGPESVGDPDLWIDDVSIEVPAVKP